MPNSPPVIEMRSVSSPNGVLSGIALAGKGFNGAVPVGTTSTSLTFRIYNNFAASSAVADALSCVLACYDNATNQGQATTVPVTNLYLQVKVVDYNGVATNADTTYYPIGGSTKHPLPVNSGTIAGSGAGTSTNYVTVNIKAVIPATATQGVVNQGLWIEYNASS